jgi:hypothetical protein
VGEIEEKRKEKKRKRKNERKDLRVVYPGTINHIRSCF